MATSATFTINLVKHSAWRWQIGRAMCFTAAFFTRRFYCPTWALWLFFFKRPAWAKRKRR